MSPPPKVFIIGGTGAQGRPIVKGLVKDNAYSVQILTRDPNSPQAQSLLSLSDNVSLIEGTFASEADLRKGFEGCTLAFINIDGFNCGEKTETYWAIRSYELALECGIKFIVYGNLDYGLKKGGYDARYRCGHYDAKGRMGEWVLQQTRENGKRMGAALFTTGPYIEMTIASMTIMTPTVEDGVVTWRMPLGEGAVPHVSLEDCGVYVRWLFDHQDRAYGMDLEVAIDHVSYHDLAMAFEKVSGHPARYIDTSLDEYWKTGPLAFIADKPCGYNSDPKDPAHMSMRDNFSGFWNLWANSGGNAGVVKRNYGLLDEIFPGRVSNAEQWFRDEQERGLELGLGSLWDRVNEMKPVLKGSQDGMKGTL
ncbi:NmrA family protein [Venturia nashicola]|nr:NmrA family protein [Venturia nashicola]